MSAQPAPPPPQDPLESRVARVEGTLGQMNERLGGIESRTSALEQKLDTGFAEMRRETTEVRRDLMGINNRMTALIITAILLIVLTRLLGF